jgi:hypothetical protein
MKVESQFPRAKANLADLPTGQEQLKLGKHQMTTSLFNSEVNMVSDWLLEHGKKNDQQKIQTPEKKP